MRRRRRRRRRKEKGERGARGQGVNRLIERRATRETRPEWLLFARARAESERGLLPTTLVLIVTAATCASSSSSFTSSSSVSDGGPTLSRLVFLDRFFRKASHGLIVIESISLTNDRRWVYYPPRRTKSTLSITVYSNPCSNAYTWIDYAAHSAIVNPIQFQLKITHES